MKIEKKSTYVLLTSDEKSFSALYASFLKFEKTHPNTHIILEISNNINIKYQNFLLLLEVSKQKKKNGLSFVIINTKVDVDDYPEILAIAPTLVEAENILEMEAIERELGF